MMHSGRMGEWVVVAVLAFGQSACTSMVPLEAADTSAVLASIEAGDRLSVLDRHGVTTDLVVMAVGADFVEGRAGGDQTVRIAAAEVQEIREQRLAPGKTIALGAGVGVLLFMQAASTWGSIGW